MNNNITITNVVHNLFAPELEWRKRGYRNYPGLASGMGDDPFVIQRQSERDGATAPDINNASLWLLTGEHRASDISNMVASLADIVSKKSDFNIKIDFSPATVLIHKMVSCYLRELDVISMIKGGRPFHVNSVGGEQPGHSVIHIFRN